MNKQNPIRARAATEIRYFSDRLLDAQIREAAAYACNNRHYMNSLCSLFTRPLAKRNTRIQRGGLPRRQRRFL
jgi:hypothetical protein